MNFDISGWRKGFESALPCLVVSIIMVRKPDLDLLYCRLMIEKLERVDPSLLDDDEKLAFWINIYNALLMHVR
jgi:hypothetical protein